MPRRKKPYLLDSPDRDSTFEKRGSLRETPAVSSDTARLEAISVTPIMMSADRSSFPHAANSNILQLGVWEPCRLQSAVRSVCNRSHEHDEGCGHRKQRRSEKEENQKQDKTRPQTNRFRIMHGYLSFRPLSVPFRGSSTQNTRTEMNTTLSRRFFSTTPNPAVFTSTD